MKKTDQGDVRLQKYLSDCGLASRRAAEELIADGKVRVNGVVVTKLGTKIDPDHDKVQVGKQTIVPAQKGIILLNKPRGVVTTLDDPEGRRTITDYLTKRYRSYYPVGRLDYDSSGLVVLTNDGDLADRLLHPRFGVERVYQVRVSGRATEATMERIEQGVRLQDGIARARVRFIEGDSDTTWLELTLTEGRNRIIRRMMESVGHPVMKLRRIAHGPFKLGKLQPGQIRKLTEREYEDIRRQVLGGRTFAKLKTDDTQVRRAPKRQVARLRPDVAEHQMEERPRRFRKPAERDQRPQRDVRRPKRGERGVEVATRPDRAQEWGRAGREEESRDTRRPTRGRPMRQTPERARFSRDDSDRPPRNGERDVEVSTRRERTPDKGRAARGELRSFSESVPERRQQRKPFGGKGRRPGASTLNRGPKRRR